MNGPADISQSADPRAILVLESKMALAKVWTMRAGAPRKSASARVTHVSVLECPVIAGIGDFVAVIQRVQANLGAFIVRGNLTPAGALAASDGRRIRRLKLDRFEGGNRVPATLQDTPRHLVLLDLDGVSCPKGLDPRADPDGAVRYARSLVPEPFREVTCAYQWSGGALVRDSVLKLHLWFWLSIPATSAQLRAYFRQVDPKKVVDHALFDPIQIHYTSAPIFDSGVCDPFAGRVRTGLLHGATNQVVLPELPEPGNEPPRPRPSRTASSLNGRVSPARRRGDGTLAGDARLVFDEALRRGLEPRLSGFDVRVACPRCLERGIANENARALTWSVQTGVWRCYRCRTHTVAAGGPDLGTLMAWLGGDPRALTGNLVRPESSAADGRFAVGLAWTELQGHRGAWRGDVIDWCVNVRGWSPNLAIQVAESPDVAFACELDRSSSAAAALMSRARAPRVGERRLESRELLVGLRSPDGRIRTVERRWHRAGAPTDSGRKALQLSKADTGPPEAWGGVTHFGDLSPTTDGGPIRVVIVEGAPSFLAVQGSLRAAMRRDHVIGAAGAETLPGIATALRTTLVRRGRSPREVEIVLVPDRDPTGERAMGVAAEILRGVGNIIRVEVGDLADVAHGAPDSVDAVLRAIDSGTVLFPAPSTRADVLPFMRKSITEAEPGTLLIIEVTPGGGKTYVALIIAAEAAAQGRAVVFSMANHALLDEAESTLLRLMEEGLAPRVPIVHVRGAMQHCSFLAEAVKDGDRATAEGVRRAFAQGGRARGPCGLAFPDESRERCPRAAECPGAAEQTARPGALTLVAHTGLKSLQIDRAVCNCGGGVGAPGQCSRCGEPAVGPLVLIDERLASVEVSEIGSAQLRTLFSGSGMGRRWRDRNHPLGELARALEAVATSAAHAHAASPDPEVRRHAKHLHRAELESLLRDETVEAAARTVAAANQDPVDIVQGASKGEAPPRAKPSDARLGRSRHLPDPDAITLCHELAKFSAGGEALPQGLELRLEPNGTATWERRAVFCLPRGVALVALDGTASRSLDWAAVAAHHELELNVQRLDLDGAAPRGAIHLSTGALQPGQVWDAQLQCFEKKAPGAIRNALAFALERFELVGGGGPPASGPSRTLGIVAYKVVADALRWGAALADSPAATPPKGGAFTPDDPCAQAIAQLAVEIVRRGWRLIIGHYFADDRGTNAFEEVDIFCQLARPVPDLGATGADARAMGLEDEAVKDLSLARTAEVLFQTAARPRSLRFDRKNGPPLLVYAGTGRPPTGPELPGVVWVTNDAIVGKHAPDIEEVDHRRRLGDHAAAFGAISVAGVRKAHPELMLGQSALGRLIREVAAARVWTPHDVSTGKTQWTVWAPSLESAEAYARLHSRTDV